MSLGIFHWTIILLANDLSSLIGCALDDLDKCDLWRGFRAFLITLERLCAFTQRGIRFIGFYTTRIHTHIQAYILVYILVYIVIYSEYLSSIVPLVNLCLYIKLYIYLSLFIIVVYVKHISERPPPPVNHCCHLFSAESYIIL